jgi:signal transduction histidine kinase
VNSQDKIEEDINILLDRTTNLLNAQLGDDIQVIREFSELKTVTAEGGKLGQLFANLISNAIEAIEAKGQITLRTTPLEQSVQIDIVDTGRGIAEDKMATIFDPFYTTKDIGEGTGLGLHIAQSIVESHGGQLKASSESGKGTTLTVTLPATGSLGGIDDVGGIDGHALPETADTHDTNKPQLKAV